MQSKIYKRIEFIVNREPDRCLFYSDTLWNVCHVENPVTELNLESRIVFGYELCTKNEGHSMWDRLLQFAAMPHEKLVYVVNHRTAPSLLTTHMPWMIQLFRTAHSTTFINVRVKNDTIDRKHADLLQQQHAYSIINQFESLEP